jgi:chemotaxis protein histidine kinase CheA
MHHIPAFAAGLAEDLSPEDLHHVLGLLRGDLTRLTSALEKAAAGAEAEAFRRAAHGIAGSAGAAGIEDLEQAARRAMAVQGTDPVAMTGPAADVKVRVKRVLDEIEAAFDGSAAP